ncbi:ATP-binding protein [bacterium]|nr:ATP-binding protein [candidate division CSSED10-310 bacterium]
MGWSFGLKPVIGVVNGLDLARGGARLYYSLRELNARDTPNPGGRRPMKLAFIGSHGVGKTTLCFELAGRLKRLEYNVDIVKEVARECPLPINRATSLAAQLWILHTQCARELAACARFEMVVCDRSVLDNYAYLLHSQGTQAAVEAWLQEWLHSYDFLVKVPVWRPPTFDGTRDTGEDFQLIIDSLLDAILKKYDASVLRLQKRHRRRWIDQVLSRMNLPVQPVQLDLFTR